MKINSFIDLVITLLEEKSKKGYAVSDVIKDLKKMKLEKEEE